MTPRFNGLAPGERMQFVGGTEDFDLYVDTSDQLGDGSIFIYLCSGDSITDWGAYIWDSTRGQITGTGTEDENDAASEEFRTTLIRKKKDVEHYIRLFVPWMIE